jgi:AraC-like DNA-binding protein
VSSRTSGRRVESRAYGAPEDLRDVVEAFWMGSWDLRGQAPHVTELLGDPCVHVVFEAGGAHAGSRLVGVWTHLWRRTLEGKGRVRGVKVRAGAARAFLDAPARRFTNRITPLREVFGAEVAALERAVLDPRGDDEAFGVFADWLRARRRRAVERDVQLAVAIVDRVAADPEITTVARLAAVAGVHPRVLERLFHEHVGASPKAVIRRKRLQEVAVRIERGEALSLAALAADLGYTDQAHLARDFKSVVGKTPRAFARSVL